MTDIANLFDNAGSANLITYKGQTETGSSFAALTADLHKKISRIPELKTGSFILLLNEHPIEFYSLLFALWKNGNKVIFPTRDIFSDSLSILYYKYSVSLNEGNIAVTPNQNYVPLESNLPGDTVVFSSGSTGVPKGILHNRNNFLKNARSVADTIQATSLSNIIFLKPYLVSAISHFLVHYLTGSHLFFDNYENIQDLSAYYAETPSAGIVGAPIHVISGLKFIPESAMPAMFFTSGDFISASTIENILSRFPETTYFNVYGLAELAGRFFINRIEASIPADRYEAIGTNIPGTSYQTGESGIKVNSDFLFSGYIIDNAFRPSKNPHPSGDLVVNKDGLLFLAGRTNDEIKILGNKVALRYIEVKIRNILRQDTVVLIAQPHPTFGNLLALVIKSEKEYKRTDIIKMLREHLSPHEIPHKFFYIDDIPFTQSMKIDRNVIAAKLHSLRTIHG